MIKGRSNDKFGAFLGRSNRQGIISLVLIKAIGFNGEGEGAQRVVASKGVGLLDRVGTSIKALDINLAVSIGREIPGIFAEGTVLLDILSASALVGTRGLDGDFTPSSLVASLAESSLTSLSA